MKNGSLHKKSIFLFLSECHLSRKEGHLYFLPCQMHQKRTKQLFLLTTWRMALTTKRAITLFLSERHLSRKERHLYFLPCQMHHKRKKNCSFWLHDVQKDRYLYFFSLQNASEKDKKNCSFWLHEEWLSSQKEHFFGSFLNVIFLEKRGHLYFLPCQMHQKKDKKIVPFDYMKLKKNVICTFCLAKCIRKGQTNCSFWLHDVQKERYLYF